MKQALRRLFAAAILVSAVAPAYAQRPPAEPPRQPTPTFAWWKSESFKNELGLTDPQTDQIDKIWETTRPELRAELDELSRFEGKLSRLIQNDADEAVLSRQIDRVETARAAANKTRSIMFVQMRKALTPDQRTRLDALHERWVRDQRPPNGSPRLSDPRRDSSKRPN